jgi:hypothetical protein
MTQDPYGQPPGTGYVVRGEVVPDDQADVTTPTAPMTQFQKVASALRGDRTDPAMPAHIPSDQEAGPAEPQSPDPTGTWPGGNQAARATSQDTEGAAQDDADRDVTRPEEAVAVRSPDAEGRDYWDDADQTGAREAAPEDAALDERAAGADAAGADAASADAASADAASADAASADAAGADAAGADAAGQDPTMTQPDLYGTARAETDAARAETDTGRAETDTATAGAAESEVVGKHAGAPAQEGLRPGESDPGLGDFSDLTYGSLLPDAAEFKAQWQQVQFRFVDDPQGSVTEAADVIAQVTAKLEAAIAERQRAIAERQRALRGRWSEGKSADTESLRETLLMYRAFLHQLTGPKDA